MQTGGCTQEPVVRDTVPLIEPIAADLVSSALRRPGLSRSRSPRQPGRSATIIQAFLFDLDGTLLDTERLWVNTMENVMRQVGHPMSHEASLELVYGRAWRDIRDDIERVYPEAFASIEEMEGMMRAEFDRLRGQVDVRIPSSIALLKKLAATHRVAIVSGSSRRLIDEAMEFGGFADDIELVIATEDSPRGKPAPDPFLLAAERLGLPPSACLVFEDSRAGVLAAKAAGMRVVALQRPKAPPQDLAEADAILPDLADFSLEDFA